jgi:hypothetical protein
MTMKEEFLNCMRVLYPEGLDWEQQKRQHRGLIKCWCMAWLESMRQFVDEVPEEHQPAAFQLITERYKQALDAIQPTADYNWWPDKTWRW